MVKLLDFYADWCPPCHQMDPILEELKVELSGKVEIQKIDVDEDNATAGKYGVVSIPTYVIEKDGKEVDRTTGARPKSDFKAWIEQHL